MSVRCKNEIAFNGKLRSLRAQFKLGLLFHTHLPFSNIFLCFICSLSSSVRSFYSHPDLLLIHPPPTNFFRSHRSSTLDFHFLSHYSYIKAIMLYKGNHWTQCAGFRDASWVQLGITIDDLGTS